MYLSNQVLYYSYWIQGVLIPLQQEYLSSHKTKFISPAQSCFFLLLGDPHSPPQSLTLSPLTSRQTSCRLPSSSRKIIVTSRGAGQANPPKNRTKLSLETRMLMPIHSPQLSSDTRETLPLSSTMDSSQSAPVPEIRPSFTFPSPQVKVDYHQDAVDDNTPPPLAHHL